MSDNPGTFRVNSASEAETLGEFLNQYCSTSLQMNGFIRPRCLGKLYTFAQERSEQKLFYAVMDIELTHVFIAKDGLLPGTSWNQLQDAGRTSEHSVLDDFATFSGKVDMLYGFTSLAYRCRAWWDKYMGTLILLHDETQYDRYISAKKGRSQLKTFLDIAKKWSEIDHHIQNGLTTAFRNRLIHLINHPDTNKGNKEEIRKLVNYYDNNQLEFPDQILHVIETLINALSKIRTAESHGTGILRKYSLSMIPIYESMDFSLYNFFNEISILMSSLRDMLENRVNR